MQIFRNLGYWLVFVVIFVMSFLTPYVSDDYTYHFFYMGKDAVNPVEFDNFLIHLPTSLYNHWNLLNGRIVSHAIVQTLMQIDHTLFAFINAIVFVAFIVMILNLAEIKPDFKNVTGVFL